jgi:hypothetical protein
MQVEGYIRSLLLIETGKRVRNTYAIYPKVEDSLWKRRVILHNIIIWHHIMIKEFRFGMSVRLIR